MMQEVAAAAGRIRPAARAIGILATSATLRMRLYHRALAERGMTTVEPTAAEQERVMAAIRAVKGGDTGPRVRARVHAVMGSLVRRGAQAIVLGCTELPLVADQRDVRVPVLDGTEILARAAIREAGENPDRTREFPAPSRRSHKAISPASRAAEPARRS
jgi:aspartate racemase